MSARPVLFDCDGVLVNTEEIAVEIEREHLARAGLVYERDAFLTRFTGLPDPAFRAAVEADCRARLGEGLPPGLFEAMKAAKRERFKTDLRAVEGVRSLLAGHDGPRAVASSSGLAMLHDKLRWTGLDPFFAPHIYSADQVARGKPFPDLFEHAAKALGVSIGDCLVVEDSVNGVSAGVAAGAAVWGFTGGGHADDGLAGRLAAAGAAAVFASLAELEAKLAEV